MKRSRLLFLRHSAAAIAIAALGACQTGGQAHLAKVAPLPASAKARAEPIPVTPTLTKLWGPAELLGKNPERLTAILGPPDFKRQDPPAQLWRYAAPRCILDFYLYLLEDGKVSVTHLEARARQGRSTTLGACLSHVFQSRIEIKESQNARRR